MGKHLEEPVIGGREAIGTQEVKPVKGAKKSKLKGNELLVS